MPSCTARPDGVRTGLICCTSSGPWREIDGILTEAQRLGVRTIWRQPDVGGEPDPDADAWRTQVEAAGFTYLDAPPINDVARLLTSDR